MNARTLRKSFGLIAIAALVFAQLLVAAHACDDLTPACHHAGNSAAVCAAHCADAASNIDHSAAPDVAAPCAPPLRMGGHAHTGANGMLRHPGAALPHLGSPPIEIRYCRLRN